MTQAAQRHFAASLRDSDPQVASLIRAEEARQGQRLELVASENYVSRGQLEASASAFANVTVEGYPGARFLGASEHVDALERLAMERACRLFGATYANVQPHSGTQANQAVYLALLRRGDTILSMSLTDGGHFSHGDPDSVSGQWFHVVHYRVDSRTGIIDYEQAERQALTHHPKLIIAGGSAYPRAIDFDRLGKIARSVGAAFMVDIAHVAGLVASGLFPDPFPHADVVTSTTYKNLRGVRGGLVLTRDASLARRIDHALCPGLQGTPLLAMIAGKAAAFGEALQPEFREYNRRVLAGARTLASTLIDRGVPVVTGGTDAPFVVADLRSLGLTGAAAACHLESCDIGSNAVPIPGDIDFSRASGLRLGTSAMTTRGMQEAEWEEVAEVVVDALLEAADPGRSDAAAPSIRKRVRRICDRLHMYTPAPEGAAAAE